MPLKVLINDFSKFRYPDQGGNSELKILMISRFDTLQVLAVFAAFFRFSESVEHYLKNSERTLLNGKQHPENSERFVPNDESSFAFLLLSAQV